jgi:hypothetical protein
MGVGRWESNGAEFGFSRAAVHVRQQGVKSGPVSVPPRPRIAPLKPFDHLPAVALDGFLHLGGVAFLNHIIEHLQHGSGAAVKGDLRECQDAAAHALWTPRLNGVTHGGGVRSRSVADVQMRGVQRIRQLRAIFSHGDTPVRGRSGS